MDGTKIKANASKHKALSYAHAKKIEKQLQEEVATLMQKAQEIMSHRLQTDNGKEIYAKRKSTIETTFGIIKYVLGFRQFLLRGLQSVK